MNLAGALLLANTVYLLLGLAAYFTVVHLDTRIVVADMRIVRRQEMFDWGVRYQVAHERYRERRRNQWIVLFYSVLVLAVLAAAHRLYVESFARTVRESLALYALSLGAVDLGIFLAVKGQSELRQSRLQVLKMNIVRAYTTKNHLSLKDLMGKIGDQALLLSDSFMMFLAIATTVLGFAGVAVLILA